VEALELADRALTDDGVYVANLIDHPPLDFVRAELATLRAVFPEATTRRAMVAAFGAGTLLATIEGFLPLQNAREALAQAPAAPEKRDLKIGFIPITCATPIIMADPMGFYRRHGLNVEVVRTAGVPVAGQALVHVLLLAALRGHVVRGPMTGALQAFVLAEDWLGPSPAVDRDAALAELARRYLRGHAPADARDLARWAGLPLRDARQGMAAVDGELVHLPDGRCALADGPVPAPVPPPRLLGPFEPVLLGWTSRDDVVGEHRQLVTDNGIFRAFVMVDGRAVGTWSYADRRVTVIGLIFSKPVDKIRSFADAFRIRKDRSD